MYKFFLYLKNFTLYLFQFLQKNDFICIIQYLFNNLILIRK